jgi:DNA-binding PadR family transcriptional regulator
MGGRPANQTRLSSVELHAILKTMRNRMKLPTADEARERLPLRPVAFALLAALADGGRPGIEILDEVNSTMPGRPLLGPGTLYRLMRELRHDGLIERTARAEGNDDERQAFHLLTPLGVAVLRAEIARLRRTIELARAVSMPSKT